MSDTLTFEMTANPLSKYLRHNTWQRIAGGENVAERQENDWSRMISFNETKKRVSVHPDPEIRAASESDIINGPENM